ncbi:MAG: ABC transporter permease [Streptococcaceae bacterium]|nr:ABC transporter permease [Streptococcaceae bacterium]
MNFYVNWHTALKAINHNRKRSLLTMVGIIIGIASVITILAIGRGYEKDLTQKITNSKSDKVTVQLQFEPNNYHLYDTNTKFFQNSDLLFLREVKGIQKVEYTKPEGNIYTTIDVKGKQESKQIELVTKSTSKVATGRNLTLLDQEIENKVVTIDSELAKELYGDSFSAVGQMIEINGVCFNIVGVFSEYKSDNIFNISTNGNIQIPKKAYNHYFAEEKNTSSLTLTLDKGMDLGIVTTKAVKKLENEGTMRDLGKYEVFDTEKVKLQFGSFLRNVTYFVGAVAGISLFIAGVGVMNMMYISVSERTKEIGIRRAMGATKRSIRTQFLLEGIMLTLSGGIVGYLLGMVLAYGIGSLRDIPISIDLFTIMLAVGVSSGIGLIFSVMPASAAAKKDLIDILR